MACFRVNFTFYKVFVPFRHSTRNSINIAMQCYFDGMLGNLNFSPVSDSAPYNTNTWSDKSHFGEDRKNYIN